jgi:hypothetical protein
MKKKIDSSMLPSWSYWQGYCVAHKDDDHILHGYTFPRPLEHWRNLTGKICPLCNGYENFAVNNQKFKSVYCLCTLLKRLDECTDVAEKYEVFSRPAKLDDLQPLGLNPLTDPILVNAKRFIKRWMQFPKEWIFIQGNTGSGKTHILRAIRTELGNLAFYISSDVFQHHLFASLKIENGTNELINALAGVPILLFDDWGLEHDNTWTTDVLSSIINTRYQDPFNYPVVMTTNLEIEKMFATNDINRRRIASRMQDAQYVKMLNFSALPDFRDATVQQQLEKAQ